MWRVFISSWSCPGRLVSSEWSGYSSWLCPLTKSWQHSPASCYCKRGKWVLLELNIKHARKVQTEQMSWGHYLCISKQNRRRVTPSDHLCVPVAQKLTEWSQHGGHAWHFVPAAFPARLASCISSRCSPGPPPSAWPGPSSPASCAPILLQRASYIRQKKQTNWKHYWNPLSVGGDLDNALKNRLLFQKHFLITLTQVLYSEWAQ